MLSPFARRCSSSKIYPSEYKLKFYYLFVEFSLQRHLKSISTTKTIGLRCVIYTQQQYKVSTNVGINYPPKQLAKTDTKLMYAIGCGPVQYFATSLPQSDKMAH